MFGRRKKEEQPRVEEPKTPILDVKGLDQKGSMAIPAPPQPPQNRLGDVIWTEFARDYGNTIDEADVPKMTSAEKEAAIINLLVAIYGELRLIRDKQ